MDYLALLVGFRTVAEGVCILTNDPESPWGPDSWAVMDFDGPCAVDDVARRMDITLP
jgi:hypothetical protein